MTRLMYRRHFGVCHSKDGFQLRVEDEWIPQVIAEWATEKSLVALGHPCCGSGPLAKLHVSYRALYEWKLIPASWASWILDEDGKEWEVDPDENALDTIWFDVMNWPNRFYRRNRLITYVSLTDEQALKIHPSVADWGFVWNKDDEESDD